MSEKRETSSAEAYVATDIGTLELAAVDLTSQVARIIDHALDASPIDQRSLAAKLGVTEARVSQVVNGDGNFRVVSVAKYLRALGYATQLLAHPVEEGLPELPRKTAGRPRRSAGDAPRKAPGERRPYLVMFDAVPLPSGLAQQEGLGEMSNVAEESQLYFALPVGPK